MGAAVGILAARFMFLCDLTGHGRTDPGLDEEIAAIVDGKTLDDPATFLERARRMTPDRLRLARRLRDAPDELRRRLVAFLWRFGARVFEPEWRRVRPALREETDRRRLELRRDGLGVIARVTPTAKEAHDPHRVVFDKLYEASARLRDDPCVLLPSVHAGPHVTIKHVRGLPITVQYTIGSTPQTSFEAVDRRIRALSAPSRVRICREVLRGRRTTVDLAHYTGMPEPQVSRHLRRLREAGLVRTSREGRMVYYELETDALRRIGEDVCDALWR